MVSLVLLSFILQPLAAGADDQCPGGALTTKVETQTQQTQVSGSQTSTSAVGAALQPISAGNQSTIPVGKQDPLIEGLDNVVDPQKPDSKMKWLIWELQGSLDELRRLQAELERQEDEYEKIPWLTDPYYKIGKGEIINNLKEKIAREKEKIENAHNAMNAAKDGKGEANPPH